LTLGGKLARSTDGPTPQKPWAACLDHAQIREIVAHDAHFVFAHDEAIDYLMWNNVCGFTVNPTLELRLENVAFCE
jgi:hypothetical protein